MKSTAFLLFMVLTQIYAGELWHVVSNTASAVASANSQCWTTNARPLTNEFTLEAQKPSNMLGKKPALAGVTFTNTAGVWATLLWTVTTNSESEIIYPDDGGVHMYIPETLHMLPRKEKLTLSSNLVAHIDWKGKPFETVLESKVFFVTNRNYRLEKQPDRKIYE